MCVVVSLSTDLSLLQIRLTSSNSERTAVKDLVDDIAAELKARFKVNMDTARCPQLLQICLQRDEGIASAQDPQVTSTAQALCRLHQGDQHVACCVCLALSMRSNLLSNDAIDQHP